MGWPYGSTVDVRASCPDLFCPYNWDSECDPWGSLGLPFAIFKYTVRGKPWTLSHMRGRKDGDSNDLSLLFSLLTERTKEREKETDRNKQHRANFLILRSNRIREHGNMYLKKDRESLLFMQHIQTQKVYFGRVYTITTLLIHTLQKLLENVN